MFHSPGIATASTGIRARRRVAIYPVDISTDDSDWVAALRYYHGKRPGVRQRVGQSFSVPKMRRMVGLAAYGIVVANVIALTILVIMQRYG